MGHPLFSPQSGLARGSTVPDCRGGAEDARSEHDRTRRRPHGSHRGWRAAAGGVFRVGPPHDPHDPYEPPSLRRALRGSALRGGAWSTSWSAARRRPRQARLKTKRSSSDVRPGEGWGAVKRAGVRHESTLACRPPRGPGARPGSACPSRAQRRIHADGLELLGQRRHHRGRVRPAARWPAPARRATQPEGPPSRVAHADPPLGGSDLRACGGQLQIQTGPRPGCTTPPRSKAGKDLAAADRQRPARSARRWPRGWRRAHARQPRLRRAVPPELLESSALVLGRGRAQPQARSRRGADPRESSRTTGA